MARYFSLAWYKYIMWKTNKANYLDSRIKEDSFVQILDLVRSCKNESGATGPYW